MDGGAWARISASKESSVAEVALLLLTRKQRAVFFLLLARLLYGPRMNFECERLR
jgi:hypothetical protein